MCGKNGMIPLTGAAHAVMVPMQKALWSRTSHNYAGYNTNIPDQFRMDQFETEFTKMWIQWKRRNATVDHYAGAQ